MPSQAWDVFLNGRKIDTVFYSGKNDADDIKRSLVNHDGYDNAIVVRKQRKAKRASERKSKARGGAKTTIGMSSEQVEDLAADAGPFKGPDGIEVKVKIEERPPSSYYGGGIQRKVWAEATTKGKESAKYKAIKQKLKDDWVTDLSGSDPEAWGEYMSRAVKKLGYTLA